MKLFRLMPVLVLAFGLIGFLMASPAGAQRGYGMQHGMYGGPPDYDPGGGWSYCPYCGGRFDYRGSPEMGPGWDPGYDYRGGRGYPMDRRGMGPGMMGPPGMRGPGYEERYAYPDNRRYRRYREPLEKEEAKDMIEEMLASSRNPNLKAGDIEEKEDIFVAEILTKDGSLVDRVQIHKETGMMRSVY